MPNVKKVSLKNPCTSSNLYKISNFYLSSTSCFFIFFVTLHLFMEFFNETEWKWFLLCYLSNYIFILIYKMYIFCINVYTNNTLFLFLVYNSYSQCLQNNLFSHSIFSISLKILEYSWNIIHVHNYVLKTDLIFLRNFLWV